MTDMPDRIFAICYRGHRTAGQWVNGPGGSATAYVRAEIAEARGREIENLRARLAHAESDLAAVTALLKKVSPALSSDHAPD